MSVTMQDVLYLGQIDTLVCKQIDSMSVTIQDVLNFGQIDRSWIVKVRLYDDKINRVLFSNLEIDKIKSSCANKWIDRYKAYN